MDASSPTPLAAKHGISDRATGLAKAAEARVRMTSFAGESIRRSPDLTVPKMTVMSLLTRAQSFHDGTVHALTTDNPFAAFTLLRAYAENAAMLVWLIEKPNDLVRIYPDARREMRLSVGKLINKAGTRFSGFAAIYDQLSGFAHPAAHTALSAWRAGDGEGEIQWQSAPAFKNDDDFIMACVWVIELAEANAQLWRETWEIYFADPPLVIPPPWRPADSVGPVK